MFNHPVSIYKQRGVAEPFVDLAKDYDTWFAKPILTTRRSDCLLLQESYRKGCDVFCHSISLETNAESINISHKELTISVKCGFKFQTVDLRIIDLTQNECTEQQARDYFYNEVFLRSELKHTHKFCVFTYDSSLTDREAVRYVFCLWYKSVADLSKYLYKVIDHEKVCALVGLTPERKKKCLKWQLRIQMKNIQVFSYKAESVGTERTSGAVSEIERTQVLGLWKSRLAIRTVNRPAICFSLSIVLIFGLLACLMPLTFLSEVAVTPFLDIFMVAILGLMGYLMIRDFNFKNIALSVLCCLVCSLMFPHFVQEHHLQVVESDFYVYRSADSDIRADLCLASDLRQGYYMEFDISDGYTLIPDSSAALVDADRTDRTVIDGELKWYDYATEYHCIKQGDSLSVLFENTDKEFYQNHQSVLRLCMSEELESMGYIFRGLNPFYIYLYFFWTLTWVSLIIFSGLYGKYISTYPVLTRMSRFERDCW